jgi:hypothetical protein
MPNIMGVHKNFLERNLLQTDRNSDETFRKYQYQRPKSWLGGGGKAQLPPGMHISDDIGMQLEQTSVSRQ